MTQSVRDTGLKNHLGAEAYREFVRLVELGASDTLIGKAINKSRRRIPYFRDVYHEEQNLHKTTD